MCGIAGKLWFDASRPGDREGVARLIAALQHRGPDDQGLEVDGPVALGHRRLSIVDLSPRGRQPLRSADASYSASVHLAHTPRGLRLVQVDPDFDVERAERGRPIVERFDAPAWRCEGARPSAPIAGSFTVADVTLPPLRYVSRPDVPAFLGTERVDAA